MSEGFPFAAARSALEFRSGAREIVRTYKDKDELRLDVVIASLICAAMRGRELARSFDDISRAAPETSDRRISLKAKELEDWTQWADALAYIPASPRALLRRGFDPVERIAALCARRTGLEASPLLVSTKHALDQRHLNRSERMANRRASFEIGPGVAPAKFPRRIVLIDDVLTTGATLAAASEALLEAGASEVRAVTCCRVW